MPLGYNGAATRRRTSPRGIGFGHDSRTHYKVPRRVGSMSDEAEGEAPRQQYRPPGWKASMTGGDPPRRPQPQRRSAALAGGQGPSAAEIRRSNEARDALQTTGPRSRRAHKGIALPTQQQPYYGGPALPWQQVQEGGPGGMPGTDRMGMPQEPVYDQPWPPPGGEPRRERVGQMEFPTTVPSEEFLWEQAIHPGLPAGTQQTFTPQQMLSNELFPTQTGVITDPGQPPTTIVQAQQAEQQQNIQAQQVAFDQSVTQTGIVPPAATIRGQLTQLMSDIDSDQAPWADAAIRKVTEVMSARGLGASSITAGAITTAILESALPIAQYDAGVYGQINIQNLRVRQETMLSNTAASNAAKQINAKSVNEVNTFMTGLRDNIIKFNTTQKNAMDQFSAGEVNSANQLYSEMEINTDKFNATNSLLIAKSNAEWRRTINTANTAGVNAANSVNASNLFNVSRQAMADLWQRSRDILTWANNTAESKRDRALQVAMYTMQRDAYLQDRSHDEKKEIWGKVGNWVSDIFEDFDWSSLWGGSGG